MEIFDVVNEYGKPYHDRQYTRVFMLWMDADEEEFTLQKEEVDSVLWMDLEQCIDGVKENSFTNCIDLGELMMVRNTAMQQRLDISDEKGDNVY